MTCIDSSTGKLNATIWLLVLTSNPSRLFTFIVGFSGISVIPTSVVHGLLQYLVEVFLMGQDPWKALEMAVAGELELLKHSSVTLLFQKDGSVQCRTLALSYPPIRMWGILLPGCPSPTCSAKPLDVRSELHRKCIVFHEKARFSCKICGFRTGWIKRPSWLHELGAAYPRRFWHDSPIHHSHLSSFTTSLQTSVVASGENDANDEVMDVDG
jgi:hypothetical protein